MAISISKFAHRESFESDDKSLTVKVSRDKFRGSVVRMSHEGNQIAHLACGGSELTLRAGAGEEADEIVNGILKRFGLDKSRGASTVSSADGIGSSMQCDGKLCDERMCATFKLA